MLNPHHQTFDFIADIVDEVALEGLDGITLSALWTRLTHRPGFSIALDESSKAYLWNAISIHPDLQFYQLAEPRPLLDLFNRYDSNHRDPETGMCLEVLKENAPEDIYPVKIVDDKENKEIRGSCATYETRKCIAEFIRNKKKVLMNYDDVVGKYDETLVIAAAQKVRTKLLLGLTTDPQLELSNMQYVMLEMVGRSREHGIITTGQVCSFIGLKETPKSLFYHRKLLMKKQLIRRQLHFQRNKSATQWGFVFHLPRFYVERPTAVNLMLQKLCSILSSKPNQRAQFAALRSESGIPETTFKKILARGQPLSQFTEVVTLKYRDMYPDADDLEALSAKKTERLLKVVQLVKPFSWNSLSEEGDGEDEDEEFDLSYAKAKANSCDASRLMLIRPIICQAYDMLYDHSPEGLSERELQRLLGVTRLDARSICRYLTRSNIVGTYMKDKGRQRMTMYVIAEHLHMSQAHRTIVEERQKIIDSENVEDTSRQLRELSSEAKSAPVTLTNRIMRDPTAKRSTPNSRGKASAKSQPPSQGDNGTPAKTEPETTFHFYDKNLTARQLSRANFILETVRKQVFVDDIYKIQRALSDKEVKEGCETKLDKRSVMTIVQKLANEGYIKSMVTTLKLGDNIKKLHFVCTPELTHDSHHVQAALQSAKLRLVGLKYTDTKKIYESTRKPALKRSSTVASTPDESQLLDDSQADKEPSGTPSEGPVAEWRNKTVDMKFQAAMGKVYGLLPKFCRAQVLHEFLFYLIYDYCGSESPPESSCFSDEVVVLNEKELDDKSSRPTMYLENKDWKMFLPPLPQYEGYPEGWCLVSDFLQRIPVSLFVQIVNIPFQIEGFLDFLNHPIKKHYLITDLPIKLRNSLLMSRRYIFHIIEILNKLSYMGLVSFGPQVHKDKDQVYIYIHRMASVLDTTISDPGHYTISPNRDYNMRYHILTSLSDAHNYWIDMRTICLNTPLGRKLTDHDDQIPKTELRVECKIADEVVDDGRIPGDHCGAGGLDSSLCSYLKRNWQLSHPMERKPEIYKKRQKPKEHKPSVPLSLLLEKNTDSPSVDSRKRLNKLPKPANKIEEAQSSSSGLQNKKLSVSVTAVPSLLGPKNKPKFSKKLKSISFSMKRKRGSEGQPNKPKRPRYGNLDSKDHEVISLMRSQRACWSPQEDTFLLLCKVTSVLMGTNRIAISGSLLRDELTKFCSKCEAKTSSACLRRFNKLMKTNKTKRFSSVMISEAMQHESLMKFSEPKLAMGSKEWSDEFVAILHKVIDIFMNKKSSMEQTLPKTLQELEEKYTVTFSSVELDHSTEHHLNPKNTVDIYCNTAFNLVLVSVCNNDLHANWSFHLYRLFQQYPEKLLRAVFTKMRRNQIISLHKTSSLNSVRYFTHRYHTSVKLRNLCHVKRYQPYIFDDGWLLYSKLKSVALSSNPYVHISPTIVDGNGMVLQALMASKMIILRTEIPTQIIAAAETKAVQSPKRMRTDSDSTFPSTTVIRDKSEVTFSDQQKTSNQSLPRSRLGLHLLRKQSVDFPMFRNIQHAGDCFVINSCNISARIRTSSRPIITPLNEFCVTKWKKPKKIEHDHDLSIYQLCNEEGIVGNERTRYAAIFKVLQFAKAVGLTHKAIFEQIKPIEVSPVKMKNILETLCEKNYIVRVGVKSHVYVTSENVIPWLLRTLVIPKDMKSLAQSRIGKEQASTSDVISLQEYNGAVPSSTASEERDDIVDQPGTCSNVSDVDNDGSDVVQALSNVPMVAAGWKRKRKKLKSTLSGVQTALNQEDCVQMDVVGRPWHKPDGFINKNTLYSWLECLTSFICVNPGSVEEDVVANFTPFLQPVYVLDLLEMLNESGCIKKIFLKKKCRNTGPFSTWSYEIAEENALYPDHEVYYEPEVDILLKLARIKSIFDIVQ